MTTTDLSSSPNAAQIEQWNGPGGAAWTALQARMDAQFEHITPALMAAAALRPGERVLDVGCGTGETSLLAADAVGPSGSVVGVDISAPMLGLARERAGARPNVSFRLEDASSARFEAPFDVVLSRFGVMFFADPVAAFASLARALAPGGRIVFVCWQDLAKNDFMTVPMRAAAPFLPPPAPVDPLAPGPGAFAAKDRVEAILGAAGLVDVALEPRDLPMPLGTGVEDAMVTVERIGPLARALAQAETGTREGALGAVRDALRQRFPTGPIVLSGHVWIVRARRPA